MCSYCPVNVLSLFVILSLDVRCVRYTYDIRALHPFNVRFVFLTHSVTYGWLTRFMFVPCSWQPAHVRCMYVHLRIVHPPNLTDWWFRHRIQYFIYTAMYADSLRLSMTGPSETYKAWLKYPWHFSRIWVIKVTTPPLACNFVTMKIMSLPQLIANSSPLELV